MSTTASSASQFKVNLLSLACIKKHDPVGPDEPQLSINGTLKFSGSMEKGAPPVDLRPRSALFTASAAIKLVEVDKGTSDDLGTITATSAQAGQGEVRDFFDRKTNALYELVYEVVEA